MTRYHAILLVFTLFCLPVWRFFILRSGSFAGGFMGGVLMVPGYLAFMALCIAFQKPSTPPWVRLPLIE